tara:strand:- start:1268 stop:1468 length:201 start_codon:yes stop_codon:yes gene_type:complete
VGDRRMISQLFNNLIGIAFKYSSKVEYFIVEIGCLEHDLKNVFFIKDNGIGIDLGLKNKVFDLFSK